MGKILVIDDTPFWRDIAADALRQRGHTVLTASDGIEGLDMLSTSGADLILLDVEMPRLSGLSFLDRLQQNSRWKNLPVIMLTGNMVKEDILRAKKLGVADYLIKSRFDLLGLLDRVQKRLGAGVGQGTVRAAAPGPARIAPTQPSSSEPPLTRQRSLDRVDKAMEGRMVSGVLAEVIAYAGAQQMEVSNLARMIGRDPVMSARVLHTANSAVYASSRGTISTLDEAIRRMGSSAIREIAAAAAAVFEAMPPCESDGFNFVYCWQQSLAVAMLCGQLVGEEQRGVAYLVGLCHNLGEILFRTHFADEYRRVLEAEKTTGLSRRELERSMLGITRGELVEKILFRLQLPAAICKPIVVFHRSQPLPVAERGCRGAPGAVADRCRTVFLGLVHSCR